MSTLTLKKSASQKHSHLPDLPDDVTYQILDMLQPKDIAAYSMLTQSAYKTAHSPTIWASAARRHLAIASSSCTTSPNVYSHARSLQCHWCVAKGLFVTGVPVHRRSGFVLVKGRGGVEVAVDNGNNSATEACYVFGGRFGNRAVPSQIMCMVMQFGLGAAGPFPVNGLNCRIIHAAEPRRKKKKSLHANNHGKFPVNVKDDMIENEEEDEDDENLEHTTYDRKSLVYDNDNSMNEEDEFDENKNEIEVLTTETDIIVQAKIIVKVNDQIVHQEVCKPALSFSELHIYIPPNVLVTKPALNTFSVEYERESTAGYWLRDVSLTPTILPFPPLSSNVFEFPLAVSEHANHNKISSSSASSSSYSSTTSRVLGSTSSSTSTSSSMKSHHTNSVIKMNLNLMKLQSSMIASPRQDGATGNIKVSPLTLEQLGDLINLSSTTSSSPVHHEKVGRIQNVGKRPKHLYHKQNQHHRSPRSPRSIVRKTH